jgi:hypothetical protein
MFSHLNTAKSDVTLAAIRANEIKFAFSIALPFVDQLVQHFIEAST